jgi:hypothetical protein
MKDCLQNEIFCWYESHVPGISAEIFLTSDHSWYIEHDGNGSFDVTEHYWLADLMQGWMRECDPDRNKALNKMLAADKEVAKQVFVKFGLKPDEL